MDDLGWFMARQSMEMERLIKGIVNDMNFWDILKSNYWINPPSLKRGTGLKIKNKPCN